ncbi:MAG: hypothetical protein II336_20060 [Loktanella sp.]|nr:hypothetical protein [Loktanella sp.]
MAISALAISTFLGNQCDRARRLDAKGFVVTDASHATSCPGIFAEGNVRATPVKRVVSAVGEGSVVISEVWEHVAGADLR